MCDSKNRHYLRRLAQLLELKSKVCCFAFMIVYSFLLEYNLKLGLIMLHLLLYIPCITWHVDTEDHLHIYHMIFLSFSKINLRLQHNSIVCNARHWCLHSNFRLLLRHGMNIARSLRYIKIDSYGVKKIFVYIDTLF